MNWRKLRRGSGEEDFWVCTDESEPLTERLFCRFPSFYCLYNELVCLRACASFLLHTSLLRVFCHCVNIFIWIQWINCRKSGLFTHHNCFNMSNLFIEVCPPLFLSLSMHQASQLGVYRAFVDNYELAVETAEKCCQANTQFAEISEVRRREVRRDKSTEQG